MDQERRDYSAVKKKKHCKFKKGMLHLLQVKSQPSSFHLSNLGIPRVNLHETNFDFPYSCIFSALNRIEEIPNNVNS